MEKIKFKSIDHYLNHVPGYAVKRLQKIRKVVKSVAPEAEEVISYNMPALHYKGILVYYAAYAKHIGFYALPETHQVFEKELDNYKTGKGSAQFPYNQPLPIELIKKMTRYRYEQKLTEK